MDGGLHARRDASAGADGARKALAAAVAALKTVRADGERPASERVDAIIDALLPALEALEGPGVL